jgi:hypothetical protein
MDAQMLGYLLHGINGTAMERWAVNKVKQMNKGECKTLLEAKVCGV